MIFDLFFPDSEYDMEYGMGREIDEDNVLLDEFFCIFLCSYVIYFSEITNIPSETKNKCINIPFY